MNKIENLKKQIENKKKLLANKSLINRLPDKGEKIRQQIAKLEEQLKLESQTPKTEKKTDLQNAVKMMPPPPPSKKMENLTSHLKSLAENVKYRRQFIEKDGIDYIKNTPPLILEDITKDAKTLKIDEQQILDFKEMLIQHRKEYEENIRKRKEYFEKAKRDPEFLRSSHQMNRQRDEEFIKKMKEIENLLIKGKRGIEYEKKHNIQPKRKIKLIDVNEAIEFEKMHEEELIKKQMERLTLDDDEEEMEYETYEDEGIDLDEEM